MHARAFLLSVALAAVAATSGAWTVYLQPAAVTVQTGSVFVVDVVLISNPSLGELPVDELRVLVQPYTSYVIAVGASPGDAFNPVVSSGPIIDNSGAFGLLLYGVSRLPGGAGFSGAATALSITFQCQGQSASYPVPVYVSLFNWGTASYQGVQPPLVLTQVVSVAEPSSAVLLGATLVSAGLITRTTERKRLSCQGRTKLPPA